MIVRKLRLQKGWSQEHLAHLCGLNVRTIQRIEQGQKPSLESKKSLAAVFEVDIASFDQLHAKASINPKSDISTHSAGEQTMSENNPDPLNPTSLHSDPLYSSEDQDTESSSDNASVAHIDPEEQAAIQYAKNIKDFLTNAFLMLVFIPVILYKVEFNSSVMWVILAWIAGTILHGLYAFEKISFFNIFKTDWEKKLAEKKLGRKL